MNNFILLFSTLLISFTSLLANVAYVGDTSNVYAIDTATNSVVATIPLGTNPILIAITPNNLYAYVTELGTDSIAVIETATNTIFTTISLPVGSGPLGIAITPDGKFAYVTNQVSGTVSVISTATNQVVATIPGFVEPWGICITPNGQFAYVVDLNTGTVPGYVSVIDLSTNTVIIPTIFVDYGPTGNAITPDGKYVYVTNENSNTVSVIDTASNTVVATIPVGVNPFEVTANPNGQYVYVSNNAYTDPPASSVSVISTDTNTVIATISLGSSGPADLAVTPDSLTLYVTNTENIAIISTLSNEVTGFIALPHTSSIAITHTLIANLTGRQKANDFGTVTEYYNHLQWQAVPYSDVIGYNVYRNGVRIASLNGETFQYNDHDQRRNVPTLYAVAPVQASGQEGTPLTLVVP